MSYLIAHNGATIYGGCERWTVRTLAALQQRGRRVKLYCNHEIVAQQARAHGVPVQLAPLRGDLLFTDALRVAVLLRREQPDIVLFTTFKKIWLGGMAARLARVPRTVLRVGLSTDAPQRRAKYRIALRWIDQVIVNAPDIAPLYPGSSFIPNGVATPQVTIARADFRAQLQLPTEAFVIGTVSRMSQQKRIDRLIDVLTQLPENVVVLIAGGGGRIRELQARAAERGVQHRMRFLGQRDDVGNVLNALDAFVSTSDREGMSHALLEAMAMGLPIVSTPVSGAGYALAEDAGMVTGEFTATAVAEAVGRVIASSELRARLGAAARARYQEQFTLERMVGAYERVLFNE